MHTLLFVITLIIVLEAILTSVKCFGFRRFFLRELHSSPRKPERWPRVALLAPCKGVDPNLEENIRSWLNQDYPDFQIFFVVESADDPAYSVLEELSPNPVLIAGFAEDSGQKIHNLRFAIQPLEPEFEVLAFVDSDAKVNPHWLRSMILKLHENPQGAVSGYRWFRVPSASPGSNLRSIWNASVLTLYEPTGMKNFAWGGSMAIFRSVFFETSVLEFWKGSLSDDYGLTSALRAKQRPIHFVPRAMAATEEQSTMSEFLNWTSRQLLMTKLYHRSLWMQALLFHVFWFLWIALGIVLHPLWFVIAYAITHVAQAIKAEIRLSCARQVFGRDKIGHRIYYWIAPPVIAFFNLLFLIGNIFTRRVTWRGIQYDLTGRLKVEGRREQAPD